MKKNQFFYKESVYRNLCVIQEYIYQILSIEPTTLRDLSPALHLVNISDLLVNFTI